MKQKTVKHMRKKRLDACIRTAFLELLDEEIAAVPQYSPGAEVAGPARTRKHLSPAKALLVAALAILLAALTAVTAGAILKKVRYRLELEDHDTYWDVLIFTRNGCGREVRATKPTVSCVEEVYLFSSVPEGYVHTDSIRGRSSAITTWNKGESELRITQYRAENSTFYKNNEVDESVTFEKDGVTINRTSKLGVNTYFWLDGPYYFSIDYYGTELDDEKILALIDTLTVSEKWTFEDGVLSRVE